MKEKAIHWLNHDINDYLFYVAYGLYLVISILNNSRFVSTFPNWPINKLLTLAILLLMLKAFLNRTYAYQERLGICLAFGILVWINFSIGDVVTNPITWIVAFILSARDIEFQKIVKMTIVISSIMLGLVIFCSLLKVIPNDVMGYPDRTRYFLGFTYPSLPPTLLFNITALLVYLKRNSLGKAALITLLAVNILLFIFTDSRNPFILVCIALATVLLLQHRSSLLENMHVLGWIMVFSTLIFGVLSIYLAYIYDPNVHWLATLNGWLSGRLRLGHVSIVTRGIKWFPRPFPMSTAGGSSSPTYNYIDSAYLQVLQEYGILLCVAFEGVLIWGYWKIWKQKEYYLLIVLTFMALNAMIDRNLMRLHFNTFWMALGVALFASSEERDLLTAHTRYIPVDQINAVVNQYGASPGKEQKAAVERARKQARERAKSEAEGWMSASSGSTNEVRRAKQMDDQAARIAKDILKRQRTKSSTGLFNADRAAPNEKTAKNGRPGHTRHYRRDEEQS